MLTTRDATGSTKRSIFRNLFLSMIAFGIFVGLIFPPFARLVLQSPRALSLTFFVLCVLAGFIVGLVNFQLFRVVVSKELARLADAMGHILTNVSDAEAGGQGCAEDCYLDVTSQDAIGDIETAFNDMTEAIARRLGLEGATQKLHATLAASVELDDVARSILESMTAINDSAAGLLYGDLDDDFRLLAHFGVDLTDELPRSLSKSFGPLSQALSGGKVVILSTQDDLAWVRLSTPLGAFQPESILVIPLMDKQRPVGLVVTAQRQGHLDRETQQVIETLRTQAAPYLHNAMLHRKIRDLAALDDLTMILNRRFGMRRLREEFARSVRHGVPVSVIMLDIDHFKKFNDTFGHDAGDGILKAIASLLENNLRSGDVVCRYGGEEFMVVAPGTGINDAASLAERLRRLIESTQVGWGETALAVTASLGLATWPIQRASTSEELVTAADRGLDHAKQSGRNQVAVVQADQLLTYRELTAEQSKAVAAPS